MKSWFLLELSKPDKLLMALHIHAIYTMHNAYRHGLPRGELELAIQKIIMEVPLRSNLRSFVHNVLRPGRGGNISEQLEDG